MHLSPKAFDLLTILVENRPWAMSKADLHARVWPGTFVSDTSLATLVNEIRTGLQDSARHPRFVRTVHGYGYAFCRSAEASTGQERMGGARCWVKWEGREIPLGEGTNVLGRAFDSAVRVDLPEISRRHASVVISGTQATLEDLESRNGTFVREERITAPRPLRDGDEIRLGTVCLTFHVASDGGTTKAVPSDRTGTS